MDSHLQALESGPPEKVRVRIPRLLSETNRVYRDKDIIQGIHNVFFTEKVNTMYQFPMNLENGKFFQLIVHYRSGR